MSTAALILETTPTKQQLTDYANAVAQVNNYAYAITQTSLPVLNRPPSNYADFAEKFGPAKANALTWSGSLFPEMLSLPQTILNANTLFDLDATEAGQYLDILIKDPTNTSAKQGLASAINMMQTMIQAQVTTVGSIETGLSTFATAIQADATALADIATKALQDAGADEDQIKTLNTQIDQLNSEINSLQNWLTISEIGMGLSIFIGLIGAVVAIIPGAQGAGVAIIAFAVLGLAGSIAGTVIINKEIDADNRLIQDKRNEISELNQDITALNGVNKQFEYLVQANTTAQKALKTVKDMWDSLDADLETVKNDLASTSSDATSAQYAQAKTDLANAQTAWAEVVDFANALVGINYKWQDQAGNWHDVNAQPPQPDSSSVSVIGQSS